ncbi:MAG: hypothetical protein STSR0006_02610 [Lentimicrobium sp.]
MRKLSLITMLLLFSGILFPQTAPKFVYAEIVGTAKFMSTKVTIEVSFGQRLKPLPTTGSKTQKQVSLSYLIQ